MQLNDIKMPKGANKNRKRRGRGRSSGLGKTSGYGYNGQKAKSGRGKGPGFEGGQTPMMRKIPKRGFKRYGKLKFSEVNVGQLEKVAALGELTPEILKKKKVIDDIQSGLRVLGNGEIKVAVTIHASHFTKTAIAKIEAAGGKAVVIK